MRIALVSATSFEVQPFIDYLQQSWTGEAQDDWQNGPVHLRQLITGPGIPGTIYGLTRLHYAWPVDLVIHAGIAGAFDVKVPLGTTYQVISERFADLGVEERDGAFTDIFSMGLLDRNSAPFSDGKLINKQAQDFDFLPRAHGLTVNRVSGHRDSIARLRKTYTGDLESMEGAGVFYVCLQEGTPFLAIRSVSNHVEPRQRDQWNLPLAIEQLNQTLIKIIVQLRQVAGR